MCKRARSTASINDERHTKKRKLQDGSSELNVNNRRSVIPGEICSIYPNNEEIQKNYAQMFKVIDETELIQNLFVTESIVHVISEFSIGIFVECCNASCKEPLSFLHLSTKPVPKECEYCQTPNFHHYCYLHNKHYAKIESRAPFCLDCNKPVCEQLFLECQRCKSGICGGCAEEQLCWNCRNEKEKHQMNRIERKSFCMRKEIPYFRDY